MFEIVTKNSALTGLQNNSDFTLLNCRHSFKSKQLDGKTDQKQTHT